MEAAVASGCACLRVSHACNARSLVLKCPRNQSRKRNHHTRFYDFCFHVEYLQTVAHDWFWTRGTATAEYCATLNSQLLAIVPYPRAQRRSLLLREALPCPTTYEHRVVKHALPFETRQPRVQTKNRTGGKVKSYLARSLSPTFQFLGRACARKELYHIIYVMDIAQ